jgi:hypothetical protein
MEGHMNAVATISSCLHITIVYLTAAANPEHYSYLEPRVALLLSINKVPVFFFFQSGIYARKFY